MTGFLIEDVFNKLYLTNNNSDNSILKYFMKVIFTSKDISPFSILTFL